jgi:hypothetical protein
VYTGDMNDPTIPPDPNEELGGFIVRPSTDGAMLFLIHRGHDAYALYPDHARWLRDRLDAFLREREERPWPKT